MRLDDLCLHPVVAAVGGAFAAGSTDLFLVGGSVRDALSGVATFADLDFTTSARPGKIRRLVEHLGPLWDVGARFGTIGVAITTPDGPMKVEITTFRSDVYEAGSRKPQVGFGDRIEDDLRRRDLTINAAALCVVGDGTYVPGRVVDPFGAANDLAARVLRTPDDPNRTMDEDPLRQLRVVRFAATRAMAVDPVLAAAIRRQAPRLTIVSRERTRDELLKIAAQGPRALAAAARLANELGVAGALFGGLATERGAAVLERLEEADATVGLAALVSGAAGLERGLRAMKLTNELRTSVLEALHIARLLLTPSEDRLLARRLLRTSSDEALDRARRLAMAIAPNAPAGLPLGELAELWDLAPALRTELPIDGHDLVAAGLSGRAVGEALTRATDAFLEDPSLGPEALLDAALGSLGQKI